MQLASWTQLPVVVKTELFFVRIWSEKYYVDSRTLLREENFSCLVLRALEVFHTCHRDDISAPSSWVLWPLVGHKSEHFAQGQRRSAGHRWFSPTPCFYQKSHPKARRVVFHWSRSLSRSDAGTNEAQFLQNWVFVLIGFGPGKIQSLMLLWHLGQEKPTLWVVRYLIKGWAQLCIAEGTRAPISSKDPPAFISFHELDTCQQTPWPCFSNWLSHLAARVVRARWHTFTARTVGYSHQLRSGWT